MTDQPETGPVNDMRELYALQHAITDAGGTLTPDVHKAIDVLRETWDAALRRAQAEAHQYRTALQGTARAAAPAGPAPATDRDTLRQRIAEALYEAEYPGFDWRQAHSIDWEQSLARANALLAVLPASVDRAAVLAEAIAKLRATPLQCTALTGPVWYGQGWKDAITELEEIADGMESMPRRLAVEAQHLPYVHTDDDGDQLHIGALTTSRPEGDMRQVYVCVQESDEQATAYIRPDAVERVVTALRAARHAAEEMASKAQQDGEQP